MATNGCADVKQSRFIPIIDSLLGNSSSGPAVGQHHAVLANLPSPVIHNPSFARFDEILHLVENASGLTLSVHVPTVSHLKNGHIHCLIVYQIDDSVISLSHPIPILVAC
jgi:hypothetical protein